MSKDSRNRARMQRNIAKSQGMSVEETVAQLERMVAEGTVKWVRHVGYMIRQPAPGVPA